MRNSLGAGANGCCVLGRIQGITSEPLQKFGASRFVDVEDTALLYIAAAVRTTPHFPNSNVEGGIEGRNKYASLIQSQRTTFKAKKLANRRTMLPLLRPLRRQPVGLRAPRPVHHTALFSQRVLVRPLLTVETTAISNRGLGRTSCCGNENPTWPETTRRTWPHSNTMRTSRLHSRLNQS